MTLLQKMEEECDCTEVIFQDYIQSRNTHKIFLFFEGRMILNIIGVEYPHL